MKSYIRYSLILVALMTSILSGCSTYKGDFVQKTEQELALMEKENEKAHSAFAFKDYAGANVILDKLTKERTVSRPLYQLEKLSVLLLSEKYDEAHELIVKLHEDLETLVDTQLEKKAASIWHGEVNKVYKGDSYERATFYALMALSFIRKGNYEDALRSVKNGLLSDADSNKENAIADYALLHYLGFFCAEKMNDKSEAQEYLRGMMQALGMRGFIVEDFDKNKVSHCFEQLQKTDPNVFLVVWTGKAPTVVCTGRYKEKRSIICGSTPYDSISVTVASAPTKFTPNKLADIEYQATTRGGREMDNILKDQATAKLAMNVSKNVLYVLGTTLIVVAPRFASSPPVALGLLGGGIGCYIVGGTLHIIGKLMNPAADGRYWRNLPGQLQLVPLRLPPGKHYVMLNGHKDFDYTGMTIRAVDVPNDGKNISVFHMTMNYPFISSQMRNEEKIKKEMCEKADNNRLMKELK